MKWGGAFQNYNENIAILNVHEPGKINITYKEENCKKHKEK
jgi:hypothetical protein